MPHQPSFPPELMVAIAREAWLDVALWDHAELYLALVHTHPYLCMAMPAIAWKYVFCRSRKEFRLYLHLRYWGVLSSKHRDLPHAELHVACVYLDNFRHEPREANTCGRPAFDGLLAGEEFCAAPMTAIYADDPNGNHGMMSQMDLNSSLIDISMLTDLRIINTYFGRVRPSSIMTYPALRRLTLTIHHESWRDEPCFEQFPNLQSLTFRGTIASVKCYLKYLPETLEEFAVEIPPSYQNSPDGVDTFGLTSALWYGFMLGPNEARAPRVVIITGPAEFTSWRYAIAMAQKKSVHLERRIEHRAPHTEMATLCPLPYDLNVAFLDV
jgi:hypothetical protein